MTEKIVIFAPVVYGISEQIVLAIGNNLKTRFGDDFSIDFMDELPFQNSKFIRKILLKFGSEKLICALVRMKLENQKITDADRLLIIRGRYLDSDSVDYIVSNFDEGKISVYYWDSQKNLPYLKSQVQNFENVFTFDPVDAKVFNLSYLPLFFPRKFVSNKFSQCKYEIGYYGTFYGRRLEAVKIVTDFAATQNIQFKNALFVSRFQLLKNLLLNPRNYSNLCKLSKRTPTSPSEVIGRSKVIFDYCESEQNGISFRLMEAISNGRKIITNNRELKALIGESVDIVYFDELENLQSCLDNISKDFFEIAPTHQVPRDLKLDHWVKQFIT